MDNLLIFISNVIIQTFLCGYTIYSISKFFKSEEYSKKTNYIAIYIICNNSYNYFVYKTMVTISKYYN